MSSQQRKSLPRIWLRMFVCVNRRSPGEMHRRRRPEPPAHRVGNAAHDLNNPVASLALAVFAFSLYHPMNSGCFFSLRRRLGMAVRSMMVVREVPAKDPQEVALSALWVRFPGSNAEEGDRVKMSQRNVWGGAYSVRRVKNAYRPEGLSVRCTL